MPFPRKFFNIDMQRVCLDRQRRNPLIDRKIRGSILLVGKLNAYQKRQILISFSIQTLSHTFINNENSLNDIEKKKVFFNNLEKENLNSRHS
jgi:hypothetical protein